MAGVISYADFYSEDTIAKLAIINDELEWASPKKKSFLLLWLREKANRAKIKGSANEKTLYLGAELADNIAKALKDDMFGEFDRQYMDYLFRCANIDNFSTTSHLMLEKYLDEKRVLSELGKLSEHMLDNKMIYVLTKVLREEPKEQWYNELIGVCEDSVALRKYYASVFGLSEKEIKTIGEGYTPEEKSVVYMILGEGAKPEIAMFIKKIKEHETGQTLYIFCHEDPTNDGKLEYFTVSSAEVPFVPIAKSADNDSNIDRLLLSMKEMADFSEEVYLQKPSVTEISERYIRQGITGNDVFYQDFKKFLKAERDKKEWSFGKGNVGEQIAAAPAYAKIKAFRFKMIQFEAIGSYSIPMRKLIEKMQEEEEDEQRLIEEIFSTMHQFANMAIQLENEEQQASREREESLRLSQEKQKPSPER